MEIEIKLPQLERIATALETLVNRELAKRVFTTGGVIAFANIKPSSYGGSMPNFTLPATQADEPYSISPVVAQDAEGNNIPVTESFTSSDETVVQINGDVRSGSIHFGVPGAATATYVAMANGAPIKTTAFNFTLGPGPVFSVSGGEVAFTNIKPDPEPTV